MSFLWDRVSTAQKIAIGVTVPAAALISYLLWKGSQHDDDVAEVGIVTSRQTVITISIPHHAVGGVIGRQGANIKEIQTVSGARVNFNDRTQEKGDTSDRLVTIRGTSQEAQQAQLMITKLLSELPVITSAEISVPKSLVGRIIGKGGDQIREIRQVSKARINVGHGITGVNEVPIQLEGSQEQIDLAKSIIEDIVAEAGLSRERTAEIVSQRPERRKANSGGAGPPGHTTTVGNIDLPPRTAVWPSHSDSYIEVFVSAVEHPHHFWCQIVSASSAQLDSLTQVMTQYYASVDTTETALTVGDMVAAPFEWDQAWYRARVLDVLDSEVDLYYVDFGDSCLVPRERVRPLRHDYLRLAFQAVECRLADVETTSDDDTWSDAACARFEELTHCAKWRVLMAQAVNYISTDDGVMPCLRLMDTHGPEDVDVAERLIAEGLAVSASLTPSSSSAAAPTAATSAAAGAENGMTNGHRSLNDASQPDDTTSQSTVCSDGATQNRKDRIAVQQVLDFGKLEVM